MGKCILIVDDDAGARALVGSMLRNRGYEVEAVEDGKAVPEKIAQRRPDLIIMDYFMPEVDGVKAAEAIISSPDFSKIPILFLSALKNTDNRSGARFDISIKDRSFKILAKPVDKDELLGEIDQLIGS